MNRIAVLSLALVIVLGCRGHGRSFSQALSSDKTTTGESRFPSAVDPASVGTYPALVKSGGGYFYDEVLEYRVWFCPGEGAERLAGGDDYFFAFAEYEAAFALSRSKKGTKEPLVLVRQSEWINEPSPGEYEVKRGERTTEWKVAWLQDSKRGPKSISDFLARPRKPRIDPSVVAGSTTASGPAATTPSEIEAAARRAFPGASWKAESVITGDFTCRGLAEYAILGTSNAEIVIAVFASGQSRPVGSFRFSASVRDPKSAVLSKEALDFEAAELEREVGSLPEGLQPSKTCSGLNLSDGLIDSAHIFWNRKAGRFDSWSL